MWQVNDTRSENVQSKHIFVGETRIATKINSATNDNTATERVRTYYYHSDHLGSAQTVTNWQGNIHERLEYTPYGETWIDWRNTGESSDKTPFRFTAKERDEETGLYYFGARYLDARTSRWLSVDPAMYEGDYLPGPGRDPSKLGGMGGFYNTLNFHAYGYSHNNPIRYIDPDGRSPVVPDGAMGTAAHYAIFADIDAELVRQGYEDIRYNRNAVTWDNVRIINRRPDIAALKNGKRFLWEIKPERDNTGRAQLDEYVNFYKWDGTVQTDIGGILFEGERTIPFIKPGEQASLTYWFDGGGIIKYRIDDGQSPQSERVPSPAPARGYSGNLFSSPSYFPSSRNSQVPNGWHLLPFLFRFLNFAF